MSFSVEDELRKTNESLQTIMNLQKMIIDALIPKDAPSKEEIKAFEEEDEFTSLADLKKELGKV